MCDIRKLTYRTNFIHNAIPICPQCRYWIDCFGPASDSVVEACDDLIGRRQVFSNLGLPSLTQFLSEDGAFLYNSCSLRNHIRDPKCLPSGCSVLIGIPWVGATYIMQFSF